jgi:hypothetical protein
MAKSKELIELVFKGLLASYLLFYAFEMHKHPQKFTALLSTNLSYYEEMLGTEWELASRVESYLLYYCQFLVVMSLTIVCGMRFGRYFGWIAVAVHLMLTWSRI